MTSSHFPTTYSISQISLSVTTAAESDSVGSGKGYEKVEDEEKGEVDEEKGEEVEEVRV